MKEWYRSLARRERRALLLAAAVLSMGLIYVAVVEPLPTRLDQSRSRLHAQQTLLEWMQKASKEAEHLRGSAAARPLRAADQSVLAVIDRTTRRAGLKDSVKRLVPETEDTVRVWMEGASFDRLIAWLAGLSEQYGIENTNIAVNREDEPGLVRANMTLRRGGT